MSQFRQKNLSFHSVMMTILGGIPENGCEKEPVASVKFDSPRKRLLGVCCKPHTTVPSWLWRHWGAQIYLTRFFVNCGIMHQSKSISSTGAFCSICFEEAGWVCGDCQESFWGLGIHLLLNPHGWEPVSCCQRSPGDLVGERIPLLIEGVLRPFSLVEETHSSFWTTCTRRMCSIPTVGNSVTQSTGNRDLEI